MTDPLKVRIGLHRGIVERRDGEHYGPPMHRAARIMATGHGGQIVVSELVASELGSEHGYDLISHGLHRLKGFHEPERLTEIRVPGMALDERGLRLTVSEGSLPPVDMNTFIGREDEIERILPELRPGRIVTLVGTGGVGKTRLALHLARLALPDFHDAAWFVDLASATGPERVLPLVADTLGISDEGAGSLIDPVRQALHARRMLVILDNCEHVIDSIRALLHSTCTDRMSAMILATSQRSLDVSGEHIESVAPLAFDDVPERSPAGRMFLAAARRSRPDFELGVGDADAVGRICRRLDGLPLALELAASRVSVMSVRQIAEEIQTRFDLLRTRDQQQPERHRTMAAAISWSMALLDNLDRSTLVDLSVFNSGFDFEAAVAVSGRDRFDVADSLEELVRRSLLVHRGGDELRMLVPLRLHCADELVRSGRDPSLRALHAAWVTSTFPVPLDHIDPAVAAARVDRVVESAEDIHAAHSWMVANNPAAAARFAMNLGDAWLARSRSNDGLMRMTECDNDSTPVELRVELLAWIATYGWTLGRHDEGEAASRRALELATANGLTLPVFAATRLMVRCAFSNRNDEALALADAVERELRLGRGDPSRQRGPIGVVRAVAGDAERGVALADEGVAEARKVGSMRLLSALANRILLDPASDDVALMTSEVAALARVLGRVSAQAHARAALAHRARRNGDLVGFLTGVGQFADLLLVEEPTSVVQMLGWVPPTVASTLPREAAVMSAALESLGTRHNYRGTEKEVGRRAALQVELRGSLGDGEHERATAEGSALGLGEAVDLLHWMANNVRRS